MDYYGAIENTVMTTDNQQKNYQIKRRLNIVPPKAAKKAKTIEKRVKSRIQVFYFGKFNAAPFDLNILLNQKDERSEINKSEFTGMVIDQSLGNYHHHQNDVGGYSTNVIQN